MLERLKNDICVGWSFFNPDGFTTLPVMGSELDGYYSDYMYEGEVPQFKIFDFLKILFMI